MAGFITCPECVRIGHRFRACVLPGYAWYLGSPGIFHVGKNFRVEEGTWYSGEGFDILQTPGVGFQGEALVRTRPHIAGARLRPSHPVKSASKLDFERCFFASFRHTIVPVMLLFLRSLIFYHVQKPLKSSFVFFYTLVEKLITTTKENDGLVAALWAL
ncbi:MAG: hypothetical protein IJB59_11480 [Oscillospiraceae bacterium]|nr:hypothetical protein [Oscillospiraceae bacterium]